LLFFQHPAHGIIRIRCFISISIGLVKEFAENIVLAGNYPGIRIRQGIAVTIDIVGESYRIWFPCDSLFPGKSGGIVFRFNDVPVIVFAGDNLSQTIDNLFAALRVASFS
jgi:hypothetical protein